MLSVREMSAKDGDDLQELVWAATKEAFPNRTVMQKYQYSRILQNYRVNPLFNVFVAFDDRDIVGFLISKYDNLDGLAESAHHIHLEYISPIYRGGYATKMLRDRLLDLIMGAGD